MQYNEKSYFFYQNYQNFAHFPSQKFKSKNLVNWCLQKDVSNELAARTKAERSKQDEVRTGSGKRKSTPVSGSAISPPSVSRGGSGGGRPRKQQRTSSGPPSGGNTTPASGGGAGRKKEKLYCLCRTPYDETKWVLYHVIAYALMTTHKPILWNQISAILSLQ